MSPELVQFSPRVDMGEDPETRQQMLLAAAEATRRRIEARADEIHWAGYFAAQAVME